MRRYLLDSNALNLFVYRREGAFERAVGVRRSGAVIGTGVPVVAEILGGTRASATWQTNLPRVEQVLSTLRLWPFDLQAAQEYGRLYADLRLAGVRMQVVDLMIAAIARTVPDCTIVTSDGDFSRVPGLKVENWARSAPDGTG